MPVANKQSFQTSLCSLANNGRWTYYAQLSLLFFLFFRFPFFFILLLGSSLRILQYIRNPPKGLRYVLTACWGLNLTHNFLQKPAKGSGAAYRKQAGEIAAAASWPLKKKYMIINFHNQGFEKSGLIWSSYVAFIAGLLWRRIPQMFPVRRAAPLIRPFLLLAGQV